MESCHRSRNSANAGVVLSYIPRIPRGVINKHLTAAVCFVYNRRNFCWGGVSKTLLRNKAVRYLGRISMEVYLCHMVVYRFFEKLELIHVTGNEMTNYCMIALGTIVGAVIVAFCWNRLQKRIQA